MDEWNDRDGRETEERGREQRAKEWKGQRKREREPGESEGGEGQGTRKREWMSDVAGGRAPERSAGRGAHRALPA